MLLNSCNHSYHALEQKKNVVESGDLELFIVNVSQVLLVLILLQKRLVRMDLLHVFHHAHLFATVDFVVVVNQFADYLVEESLLLQFSCLFIGFRDFRLFAI